MAAGLCRLFEGLRLRPYLCPAGVATIGYGTTRYRDGTRVLLTDPPITAGMAELMLIADLTTRYMPDVVRLCPKVRPDGLNAALLDFAYNLGAHNLAASTLRRRVNAKDTAGIKAELRKWTRGGGRVLPGLQRRREAECALF